MEPPPTDLPPAPAPQPAAPAAPPMWIVEATLVMVLAAHLLSIGALRATARAAPLFFLQACLFGPLGVFVALLGAREVARRTAQGGRGRLAALVLLAGAATILPAFTPRHLTAGALRDLERAGGAARVVEEGRARLARLEAEGRAPGPVDLADWPAGRLLGVSAHLRHAPPEPRALYVEAFRLGESSGFLIQAPGAPPRGSPLAEGLAWWSESHPR